MELPQVPEPEPPVPRCTHLYGSSMAVHGEEFSASAEDIARSVHAHPTLSEVVKEAALATIGRVIHI